jgi:hypothetical protein
MAKSKLTETELMEEAVKNIRLDRDLTYELIGELKAEVTATKSLQKDVGFTVAKYMETLQRSNEQLVKIIAIMRKDKGPKDTLDISADEADEIMDLIKEG